MNNCKARMTVSSICGGWIGGLFPGELIDAKACRKIKLEKNLLLLFKFINVHFSLTLHKSVLNSTFNVCLRLPNINSKATFSR